MQKRNSVLVLLSLFFWFFAVLFLAVPRFFGTLIGRPQKPIRENSFLDSLNFLANIWPKSFWKKPTGLKIGRSISTFLHYLFEKWQSFTTEEKKSERTSAKKTRGFSLIEMIVSITLFALIMLAAFSVFGSISLGKLSVSNQLDLNQDVYYAIEKFAALAKDGGTVDYEEYWNRKAVGVSMGSGHYLLPTLYGNSGALYSCSGMGSNWCVSGTYQKYGEYKRQFIDIWWASPDDDEDLGVWPEAFAAGAALPELYLIKKDVLPNERLYFRLDIKQDPNNTSITCNGTSTNTGCVWNLQMLRLAGSDEDHDGVTETWKCNKDYCTGVPTTVDTGWVDIFPEYINVKDAKFFIYPSKDVKSAWKWGVDIGSPYVRVLLKLWFSAERRKMLKWADPTMGIATSINLQ